MRRKRVPGSLTCPCCGKPRAENALTSLLRQEGELAHHGRSPNFATPPGWTVEYARSRPFFVWACDACLRAGRAAVAKPWLQVFCCSPPRFAYFDRPKKCRVCRTPFVFTRREQQLWFEEYKLSVDAEPIVCPRCRRAKQNWAAANAALADALHALDPRNAEQLVRIANLYLAIGSARKAAEMLRRAKNLADDPDEVARLLERIAAVEAGH